MTDWSDPAHVRDLQNTPPPERAARWRALSLAAPPADPAALDAALDAWPDEDRPAPQPAFAELHSAPATGPHDPGVDTFLGLRENPAWPWPLARHASFGFDQGFSLTALLDWAPFARLRSAWLPARNADEYAALATLLSSPHARTLRRVHLDLRGVPPTALDRILQTLPAGLTHLGLAWAGLKGEAAAPLAKTLSQRPQIVSLTLEHTRLGPAGVDALMAAGAFDRLTALRLHGAALDDRAAAAWAKRPAIGVLRTLDLQDDPFDGGFEMQYGLWSLADAGWLSGLESLRLGYHPLKGDVLAHLLEVADWQALRSLRLWSAGFGNAEARALIAAKVKLPALVEVEVVHGRLGGGEEAELDTAFSRSG